MRIGQAVDIHQLVEGRPLVLGGVQIEHEKGLLGHSDADVLVHAIAESNLEISESIFRIRIRNIKVSIRCFY